MSDSEAELLIHDVETVDNFLPGEKKLLVTISYRQTNFLDNEDIISEDKFICTAPDSLKKSDYKDFVNKYYLNQIINILEYSNKLGIYDIHDIEIESVEYVCELEIIASETF